MFWDRKPSLRAREALRTMVAPATCLDLPGEMLASTLSARDGHAYDELLRRGLIICGITSPVPRLVGYFYSEFFPEGIRPKRYGDRSWDYRQALAAITSEGWTHVDQQWTNLPIPTWSTNPWPERIKKVTDLTG